VETLTPTDSPLAYGMTIAAIVLGAGLGYRPGQRVLTPRTGRPAGFGRRIRVR
jgi:hypothetical protein